MRGHSAFEAGSVLAVLFAVRALEPVARGPGLGTLTHRFAHAAPVCSGRTDTDQEQTMKNVNPATVFAAVAAGVVLTAMSPAVDSAALRAADAAARSDYGNAVASCNRMDRDAQRRCMEDADAARNAAEGATGEDIHELGTPGGGLPTYRKLLDVERLPDNLAGNAVR
jgi:hypothetical protein